MATPALAWKARYPTPGHQLVVLQCGLCRVTVVRKSAGDMHTY